MFHLILNLYVLSPIFRIYSPGRETLSGSILPLADVLPEATTLPSAA